MRLDFSLQPIQFGRGIEIYARAHLHNGFQIGDAISIVKPLVFEQLSPNQGDEEKFEPMARIDKASAQRLMDELWRCGVRPSEGSGSAGSLAATERHLKDMRAIAFSRLDMTDPGK